MNNPLSIERYLILFMPWLLALLLWDHPLLSYLTAWMGSFFIFYMTLTGKVKALPDDRSIGGQLMRPIFLVQLIFAGYMCCTSIFYFLHVLGYVNFSKPHDFFVPNVLNLKLTAQCQRYYCLAHASFVFGILVSMRYPVVRKYEYDKSALSRLVFRMALLTFAMSYLLGFLSGLSQFAHQLNTLSFISGTLALAFAITDRKTSHIAACGLLYAFNFYHALLSGFKEPIILSVLILGIFLYPNFKRTVTFIFVPLLLMLFILLPTYNRIFREQAWAGNLSPAQATSLALKSAFNSEDESNHNGPDQSNWTFLAFRLSEINMFTKYVKSTPANVDFYGTQIIRQAITAVIPRVLWPSKPVTENMVMLRVYKAGVVFRGSRVSAKPPFIVDAYLSYGALGIFIALFSYGAVCQLIAIRAEELFGSYTLGTALIFTGLFQVFWRGQNFEFLLNSVCWSYVSMYLIFQILRFTNFLHER